nr:GAF and ANTAR domain-containing protein [Nocardioides sp. zg-1308]
MTRALAAAPDESTRLQLAVDSTVSLVTSCDHAGLTVNQRGGVLTRVGSDDVVQRANELQSELGEGPCLDVTRDQDTLVIPDLATARRYPTWAQRVHTELGVGSMMSLLVYTDQHSYGALSLYADIGRRFDADDLASAQAVAGHLAVTLSAGREIEHLSIAMHNRLTIGRAQGILMSTLDIDADAAFDYLRRMSMESNRKVVDLAEEIARTRALPPRP